MHLLITLVCWVSVCLLDLKSLAHVHFLSVLVVNGW